MASDDTHLWVRYRVLPSEDSTGACTGVPPDPAAEFVQRFEFDADEWETAPPPIGRMGPTLGRIHQVLREQTGHDRIVVLAAETSEEAARS